MYGNWRFPASGLNKTIACARGSTISFLSESSPSGDLPGLIGHSLSQFASSVIQRIQICPLRISPHRSHSAVYAGGNVPCALTCCRNSSLSHSIGLVRYRHVPWLAGKRSTVSTSSPASSRGSTTVGLRVRPRLTTARSTGHAARSVSAFAIAIDTEGSPSWALNPSPSSSKAQRSICLVTVTLDSDRARKSITFRRLSSSGRREISKSTASPLSSRHSPQLQLSRRIRSCVRSLKGRFGQQASR